MTWQSTGSGLAVGLGSEYRWDAGCQKFLLPVCALDICLTIGSSFNRNWKSDLRGFSKKTRKPNCAK